MIRVIVFGKSRLATMIAGHFHQSPSHELVAVVPSPRSSPAFASLADFGADSGVPVLSLPDVGPELHADLGVSCFFSEIFRQRHIDLFGRLVNLHNAPLPRYRGMRPLNWALRNGEDRHGVTIHEIDTGIDTGPIISACTFPVFPDDEVIDLYLRAQQFGWDLFLETVPRIMDLPGIPQDDSRASYYDSSRTEGLGDRAGFTRSGDTSTYAFPL